MSVHILNPDGSVAIRADGCAPDFLSHLATHRAYLARWAAPNASLLDGSWESLRYLDQVMAKHKATGCTIPRAVIDGIIAYCGEALRTHVGGEWTVHTCPADMHGAERYFPCILRSAGQAIAVAALVEDECDRPADSRLYIKLRVETSPPLPVGKSLGHPVGDIFPRLQNVP